MGKTPEQQHPYIRGETGKPLPKAKQEAVSNHVNRVLHNSHLLANYLSLRDELSAAFGLRNTKETQEKYNRILRLAMELNTIIPVKTARPEAEIEAELVAEIIAYDQSLSSSEDAIRHVLAEWKSRLYQAEAIDLFGRDFLASFPDLDYKT